MSRTLAGSFLAPYLIHPVRDEDVRLVRSRVVPVAAPQQALPVEGEHREAVEVVVGLVRELRHALEARAVEADQVEVERALRSVLEVAREEDALPVRREHRGEVRAP